MKLRRRILSTILLLTLAATGCSTQSAIRSSNDDNDKAVQADPTAANTEQNDYYTFELSDNVNRTSVTYRNRYGIELAADLYTPKDLDESVKYPAIVVGPPYGGVKEQGPGVYANQLAQRGFVVLAFDPAFMGESGGEPRNVSSPDIFTENFSAGVDYLGTLNYVDREKIGAIGICGSGGFALSAAQADKRIKAVATASMYDISRGDRFGFGDTVDAEQFQQTLDELAEQRWEDVDNGYPEYNPSFPAEATETVPEGLDPISDEFYRYYGTPRGHHPNALGGFTTTSRMAMSNFSLLDHIDTISPRPVLFIIGENAHSRYFSEDAYEAAAEPKELYVVPDAEHIDLYDDVTKIPFDKLELFFKDAFGITN
ncbi:MAG: alpha/beta hydrolase [Clostridia bacterium]|nr:alpha/beta hydrolase [Clostridia bacterium]